MQATKHHGAELELDPLRHTEPMKFVAESVSQSAVVLPCFGDDTSRGAERPLQLVNGGFWRLGEHGVAVVNARRHESVNQNMCNNSFAADLESSDRRT